MKSLDNKKFVELLRMMAGQDEGGFGEVFREAARRLEDAEQYMAATREVLNRLEG